MVSACIASLSVACVFLSAVTACRHAQRVELTVSAAASLTEAIQEVEAAYRHDHANVDLKNNFGSSGTLARQIEEGAPVDIFVSAATKPVDDLDHRGLVASGSRRDLLRNTLVLVAPQDSPLKSFQQLAGPGVRRVALGDPASVPAGQYGQQTLTALHLMDAVRNKLVLTKDVRQVLGYVQTGNTDAGIVYATDAATSSSVRVVATAPESSHEAIVYPAAVVAHIAHDAAARDFVNFLASGAAKAIFVRRGFTVVAQ